MSLNYKTVGAVTIPETHAEHPVISEREVNIFTDQIIERVNDALQNLPEGYRLVLIRSKVSVYLEIEPIVREKQ